MEPRLLFGGLLLFVFPFCDAVGQDKPLHFEWLSVEDGLPGTGVIATQEDPDGYLWVGSYYGLARYDGYEFRHFRPDPFDPVALPRDPVISLFDGPDGRMWIGTLSAGLFTFDYATESLARVEVPPGATDAPRAYVQDDGTLWIGSHSQGLLRRAPDSTRFHHFRHDPGDPTSLSSDQIGPVFVDSRGTVWAASGNGLNRYDPGTGTFHRSFVMEGEPATPVFSISDFDRYPRASIQSVVEVGDGSLWLATGHGLHQIDESGRLLTSFEHDPANPNSISHQWVHSIAEDEAGTLWVGTMAGLDHLDPSTGKITRHGNDPTFTPAGERPLVINLRFDRAGILWIGTAGWLGKLDLTSTRFDYFEIADGAHSTAFFAGAHGKTWVGTSRGRLHAWSPATGTVNQYWDIAPSSIQSLLEDAAGRVWIGTASDGGAILDPASGAIRRFRHNPEDDQSLFGDYVYNIRAGPDGSLWFATLSGLSHLIGDDRDGPRFDSYASFPVGSDSLMNLNVTDVAWDAADRMWISTLNGVARYDPDTERFKRYDHDAHDPQSLSHSISYSLAPDELGGMWIGTYGLLDYYDPVTDTFDHHVVDPRLSIQAVTCIASGDHLWLSTFRGVGRLDPESGRFTHYGSERGLNAESFTNGNRCHLGQDGLAYFTARDGFFFTDAVAFRDNATAPSVVIDRIRIGTNSLTPFEWDHQRSRLSHSQNDLRFGFAGIHRGRPAYNQYAFRLAGRQDEWQDLETGRSVHYADLPPGAYAFEVRAANSVGVWSDPIGTSFVIRSPWWATGQFFGLYAFALGLALFVFYESRVIRHKRRSRELESQVQERTEDLQQAVEQTTEQARQLQEMDRAKDRFFGNVSHEFRTPLTLILGPLQDTLDGRQSAESLLQDVPVMQRNARRLLRLVNQMLDLSKLEFGSLRLHKERTDAVPFLRHLVMSFSSLAEREHLTLLFDPDVQTLAAQIDRDKVEKVISNLLSNAFKFTPAGGKVRVGLVKNEESFQITVSDTGAGISEKDQVHIFDRFYQSEARPARFHEGSGIGLALAYELVELHGGALTVSSRPGFGSEFVITMPLGVMPRESDEYLDAASIPESKMEPALDHAAAPASEDPTSGLSDGSPGASERPTVLVVEDNEDMRRHIRRVLEPHFVVVTAVDGQDGLKKAHDIVPDLVVSDVMMPGLDGFGLCRALKDDSGLATIPVVLLTARTDQQSTLEGLHTGADDYLQKPFSSPELLARAINLVSSRRTLKSRFSKEIYVRPSGIAVSPEEEVFLERVLALLDKHICDSLFGMDWLAEEVGLSRRHLERRVHQLTDQTPSELLRTMRIQRAAQLLRARAGTVAEVAYMVGFRSPSHFSRVFKEVTGVAPGECRSKAPI